MTVGETKEGAGAVGPPEQGSDAGGPRFDPGKDGTPMNGVEGVYVITCKYAVGVVIVVEQLIRAILTVLTAINVAVGTVAQMGDNFGTTFNSDPVLEGAERGTDLGGYDGVDYAGEGAVPDVTNGNRADTSAWFGEEA